MFKRSKVYSGTTVETRSVHGIFNNLFMLEKVDESHSERA